ncbi:MAG TPA: hypothetical protein VJS30_31330 [Paraburkholderia sp.]|nr:hypothetical protein [Paraburkholderia sp.]
MDQTWLGMVVGAIVPIILVIAAISIHHHRRERRRADLLRNLDHHDWCRWVRVRR